MFINLKNPVYFLIFEDTNGDFPKSSVSVTPAKFVHTVAEIAINPDGDGDDSGFQSHCVEKTFDPRAPINGQMRCVPCFFLLTSINLVTVWF